MKLNESAGPQMSPPAALIVNTPLASLALPALPTAPMSTSCQGPGSVPGSEGVSVTPTLSKVAVAAAAVWWLVTASPTYTGPEPARVTVPASVQLAPFADSKPEIVSPLRASFTPRGALLADPAATVTADAPALVRACRCTPLEADTSMNANGEPALSDVRIITPALLHAYTGSRLATRATISPSPLSG